MKLRILHTPFNEANNPRGLCTAEQELGYSSRLEIFRGDGYFKTADRVWGWGSSLSNEIMRWPLIIYAMIFFNIIHYNNGSYLGPSPMHESGRFKWLKKIINRFYARPLQGIDLKIAALMGKKIFVTYQGSDARMSNYCFINYKWHFFKEPDAIVSVEMDEHRQRKIDLFEKYATQIYALNPDLLNTLPKRARFMPYASVFPEKLAPVFPTTDVEVVNIVHAPSKRSVKGTKYLLSALDRIKEEGIQYNLILVEGMANIEAMNIYRQADVVIDQLLAGWYGGFAVEVMALGKPVVAYIRESDLNHIPIEMKEELPIINANPDTIYLVLKQLLTDKKEKLLEIGQRSRNFAMKWHSPTETARYLIKDYQQDK